MAPKQLSRTATSLAVALAERCRQVIDSARTERGSAMSEYGLLIAFVFIAGIAAIAFFGESVASLFTAVNDEYEAVGTTTPPSNANTN